MGVCGAFQFNKQIEYLTKLVVCVQEAKIADQFVGDIERLSGMCRGRNLYICYIYIYKQERRGLHSRRSFSVSQNQDQFPRVPDSAKVQDKDPHMERIFHTVSLGLVSNCYIIILFHTF